MAASLVDAFEAERPRLFGLVYRMLGSVADTEDVLQDAYLRWEAARAEGSGTTIDNPAAYLTTITSRLAIDHLRSAQVRREHYVGPWLPEPVAAEPGPDDDAIVAESLTVGFLAVLERLGPVERAVFLLHDVFDLPFAEVARVVDRTEATCRQIARRARSRVRADQVRHVPTAPDQDRLVDAFLAALIEGDLANLTGLLAEDVVHLSDGGANRHAARRPIVGRDRVARFLINLARRVPPAATVERMAINGEPGVVVFDGDQPQVAMVARVSGPEIVGVWIMVNPDKLGALT